MSQATPWSAQTSTISCVPAMPPITEPAYDRRTVMSEKTSRLPASCSQVAGSLVA